MRLDKLIYDALAANETLMTIIGGRLRGKCFEVPPDEQDNVPLPYIVVTDDGDDEQLETKDCMWMPSEVTAQVSVIVSGNSDNEVHMLISFCRQIIADYMESEDLPYRETPQPRSIRRQGKQWDWLKPCTWDTLNYQCDVSLKRITDEEIKEYFHKIFYPDRNG